jgi:Tfp pilus assembly pilus retraction ATPase PilT
MFPTDEQPNIRNQISENLSAVIVQRLVDKTDGK